MPRTITIFCAGLIGWDTIGHTKWSMKPGADLPGVISTRLGGVIANIALAITVATRNRTDLELVMLSCVGNDEKSDALILQLSNKKQINCRFIIRDQGPPDSYIAIESKDGLFGAIASSAQLERACVKIFEPLAKNFVTEKNSTLGHYMIIDSNLTKDTLSYLSLEPLFKTTSFIIACASPFKARKIRSFLAKRSCIIYANLEEASEILGVNTVCSSEAAESLFKLGAKEAIVTNGKSEASSKSFNGLATYLPRTIKASKTTGAGDVFLATHFISKIYNNELSEKEHLEVASNAAQKQICE